MGAWISLNQFKYFEKQIIGFLGIGSAPEFLENLMWKKFSKKVLKIFRTAKKKLVIVKNGDHSLSSPKWLKIIKKELKLIVN